MSGNMPYLAESGASAAYVESILNGTVSHKQSGLAVLRNASVGAAFLSMAGNTRVAQAFVAHIYSDFFGETRDALGQWHQQAAYDSVSNPTTGFWDGWYVENPEAIFATAVEYALKLSLGYDANEGPARNDKIEVLWICAVEGFNVVVERRASSIVRLLLLTPGIEDHPITDDLAAGPFNGATNYACPPTNFRQQSALWVVGDRGVSGDYDAYKASGPVVVVQPSYEDGGVR